MDNFDLKKFLKEGSFEKNSTQLNENSPGFDNRVQGGPLPTLESVKAAHQAKKGKAPIQESTTKLFPTLLAFGQELKLWFEKKKDLEVKLAKGNTQPYYAPVEGNPKLAAIVAGSAKPSELFVIVNDEEGMTTLKELVKNYRMVTIDHINKLKPEERLQFNDQIVLMRELPQSRRGRTFEMILQKFNAEEHNAFLKDLVDKGIRRTLESVEEGERNDYANSEEDYTDRMVMEKIFDIIKYHELDPSEVLEVIGQEYEIDFEFTSGDSIGSQDITL